MAGPGGARPGAGRPRTRVKHAGAITRAEKKIADRLPDIVDKLLELVEGVQVQTTDADGGERVYTRPPDRAAGEYLLNRIMGKPVERQEQTGKDGGPLTVRVIYDDYGAEAPEAAPGTGAGAEGGEAV